MSATRRRLGPAAVVVVATSLGVGCGRGRSATVPAIDSCFFPSETAPGLAPDTVVLGVVTPARAEADDGLVDPVTRFLEAIRQVPLVWIDCHGRPVGGLAVSWRGDENGDTWTFTLPADTPLDAAAVRARWEQAGGGRGWPWPGIAAVTALSDHRLQVRLAAPRRDLPLEFADRRLAVEGGTLGRSVRVVASPPGLDPRTLLDPAFPTRIDLLFSRDPVVIDFARGRPEWRVIPLPWDRVYSLVTPAPLSEGLAESAALVESVRGDARVSAGPFWWTGDPHCDLDPGPSSVNPRPEIGYLGGDLVARDLAERLVALGVPRQLARLRAVPLDPARLAAAIDQGLAAGAIVVDPSQAPLGCHPRPWSTRGRFRYPLLETRASLIARRGIGPLTVDRDATVRLLAPSPP